MVFKQLKCWFPPTALSQYNYHSFTSTSPCAGMLSPRAYLHGKKSQKKQKKRLANKRSQIIKFGYRKLYCNDKKSFNSCLTFLQDETNQLKCAACCIKKNVSTGLVGKRMTVPFSHWLQWVVFLADNWMNKGALVSLFKVWTLQEQTRMGKPLTSETKQKSCVSMARTSSWNESLGQTGWIDWNSLHALKGSSDVIDAFLFYQATLKADSVW